jgi:peptidoglycan hydrolase FlgJ
MGSPVEIINKLPVPQQVDTEKEKKIKKVCADFDALLTYNLLKTMRRTVPAGGAIPRTSSRDTYEMMLDQKIAEVVAQKGQGKGLQKAMYDQITQRYRKNISSPSGNASINTINQPAGDK